MADFWRVISCTMKAVRRWARACRASCRAPALLAFLLLTGLCPQQSHAQDPWDQSAVNLCLEYLRYIDLDTTNLPNTYNVVYEIWSAFQNSIINDINQIKGDTHYIEGSGGVTNYLSVGESAANILGVTRRMRDDINHELQTMNGYLDDIWYYIENGLIGGVGGGDTNVLNSILCQLTTDSQNDVQTLRSLVDEIADITTEGVYTNSYYLGQMYAQIGQVNTTLNNLKTNSDNLKNTVSRCETILNSIKDSLTSDGKSVAEYEKLVWAYLTTTTPDGKSFKGSINDILAYCATNSIALQEISDQLSLNNYAMTNLSSVLEGLTTNLLANASNELANTYYMYGTNLFTQLRISSNSNKQFVNLIGEFESMYDGGNFNYEDFYLKAADGDMFYPTSLEGTSGITLNALKLLSYIYFFDMYNTVFSGRTSEYLGDTYNTLTNKSQSVPYTIVQPALNASGSAGLSAIYPALTNAYLNSWQQQSDMTWFDRIEALLAALVFESAANNQNTNGNGNSWGLDAGNGGTGSIESSYGQYQTGVGGLQTLVGNYRSSAIGLLSNIQSKFAGVSNTGIEWQTGIDNDYFAIDTSNTFFQLIRICAIICWSCGFLFLIVKLFAIVSPFIFKGFKFAFNIVSALIMGG